MRVLKYLQFTRDYGLHYRRYPTVLKGYNVANCISNVKDSKSHSGYLFTLGGGAFSYVYTRGRKVLMEILKTNGYCQIHNAIIVYSIKKCGEEGK